MKLLRMWLARRLWKAEIYGTERALESARLLWRSVVAQYYANGETDAWWDAVVKARDDVVKLNERLVSLIDNGPYR